MKIRMLGIETAEGALLPGMVSSPLGRASRVWLNQGLAEELAAAGATIESIAFPAIEPGAESTDKVVNLGELNARVATAVAGAFNAGALPLLAGGTCNQLIGMLSGMQAFYGPTARIGLIWLDAHGDFNTPSTSPSQMLGGMPVATAAGLCWPVWRERAGLTCPLPTDRIVMVDVRNLDPEEEQLVRATDVTVARFADGFDPAPVIEAIAQLAARVDHLYLHIDSDILDASLQPNHTTAEPNGPGLEPVYAVIDAAVETGKVRAFAVVSVNPDGSEGDISLASGRAMITRGVSALIRQELIAV
jgi:arginase